MLVEKVWILSTCHLSKKDIDILQDSCSTVSTPHYVMITADRDDDSICHIGCSEGFTEIYKMAIAAGVDYIKFDGDGPIESNLPKFDW